jgi:LAO/AO transport system kinase
VNALAKAYLAEGKRVGIVAVDPTSPYSGGSLLGDRERFRDVDGHPDLFIRSMATRGHGGGISKATRGIIEIMEAMSLNVVLLETVGVGQDQVGVSAIVDTTIMVTAPGLGDFLQCLKAGVLEAGEILVVNKADNPNAQQAAADLMALIEMGQHPEGWKPRLVSTVATRGTGIDDLLKSIQDHRLFRQQKGGVNPRQKISARREILDMVREQCLNAVACRTDLYSRLPDLVDQVLQGRQDPLHIAQALLKECNQCEDPSIEDPQEEKHA